MITTTEVGQVLTRRSYFNTFGGNPVATATGHAVLKVIEKERLQENAFAVGSYLKDRFKSLQEKHESAFIFSFVLFPLENHFIVLHSFVHKIHMFS